jgi:hypothetical protein
VQYIGSAMSAADELPGDIVKERTQSLGEDITQNLVNGDIGWRQNQRLKPPVVFKRLSGYLVKRFNSRILITVSLTF